MVATNETHDLISAEKVDGTAVYDRNGERLGSVKSVMIGKRDGKVRYAVMSFGGFLGIGDEYHPLPWDQLDYEESKGGYVVNLTKDKLEGAPRYKSGSEPNYGDPAYNRQVYDYYGSTYY